MYDTDSMHDPVGAPNDVLINTAGVYLITVSIQFAANATGARWMTVTYAFSGGLDLGGAKDSGPTAGIDSSLVAAIPYKATLTGLALNVLVQQTSGAALSVTNSATSTLSGNAPVIQFGAQWISDGS